MMSTAVVDEAEPVVDPVGRASEPPRVVSTSHVSHAVNLGWIMDKLWRIADGHEGPSDDLPGLPLERQAEVYCGQIESAIAWFGPGLESQPEVFDNLRKVWVRLSTVDHPEARAAVHTLHLILLAALTVTHYKLGKAYLLGSGLASMYRPGPGWIALSGGPPNWTHHHRTHHTVSMLVDSLADLHCVLPHNAAGTVSLSLQKTFSDAEGSSTKHDAAARRLQGHRWRAMLTGETEVIDILETADYLTAGRSLLSDFRKLAGHAVREFWFPLVAVGLLGAAGIYLSFYPPAGSWSGGVPSACLSFGAAFLAAVRIISPSLMRVAEKVGPKLWDEVLVVTVADALPKRASQRSSAPSDTGRRWWHRQVDRTQKGYMQTGGRRDTQPVARS